MSRSINPSLSRLQVAALLSELCVTLGFCLPPDSIKRLQDDPPVDVDAFTDAVILAEGLDPQTLSVSQRRQIQAKVSTHFKKAEILYESELRKDSQA